MNPKDLMIGWTTTSTLESAQQLAAYLISKKVAACVQINEVFSVYEWEGSINEDKEFRLTVKYSIDKDAAIQEILEKEHPYDTAQWVAIHADKVNDDYLKWVLSK